MATFAQKMAMAEREMAAVPGAISLLPKRHGRRPTRLADGARPGLVIALAQAMTEYLAAPAGSAREQTLRRKSGLIRDAALGHGLHLHELQAIERDARVMAGVKPLEAMEDTACAG